MRNPSKIKNQLIVSIANIWVYVWFARVVMRHIRTCGEIPNPANPKTVNDKFLWRKVFDHNPDFVGLSDKLECKQIAKDKCKDIVLPKVLWVGGDAADIPVQHLQGDVMVKATHGSGFCFPVFGGKYDREALLAETKGWLNTRYGRAHWEWGYFGLKPQLYVEELILDENGGYGTAEAKVYVYCGKIELITMIYDRHLGSAAAVLHGDWTPSTIANQIGAKDAERPLPTNRQAIEQVALQLCDGLDHMRCDLYLVGGKIYFGEYTVYNQGGYLMLDDDPKLRDAQGASWDIRQSWFLSNPQSGLDAIYARALLDLLDSAENI